MTLSPARNTSLIISIFLLVIGIMFAGAWFYKYSSPAITYTTNQVSDSGLLPAEEYQTLYLVPTGKDKEYSLVIKNLEAQVTTIAFQLTSTNVSTPISGSSIQTDSSLKQDGWITAINSQSESGSLQRLSYSLVRIGIIGEEYPSEMTLGTITLSQGAELQDLELNPEESFLTYSNSENPVRINLVKN